MVCCAGQEGDALVWFPDIGVESMGRTEGDGMTRLEIRNMVDCPFCGAKAGRACFFTGKGAARKNRAGANHVKRLYAAQDAANQVESLIDESDKVTA